MATVLEYLCDKEWSQPKRAVVLLLVGLIAVCTLSCTSQIGEEAQLRIGTNIWPGYEPLYLARELGYFSDSEIRLVEFPSASRVMRAYRNGVIDAAALTLDEAILLLSQGHNPRIVLVMDISAGADAIVARPKIQSIADLAQRQVGVENSALGAFLLGRALELNRMTVDQIQIESIPIDKQFRAYAQGQVDALVTFEPVKTALQKEGAHILFDSTQIPGEIVDVLVVREQFLQQNPNIAEKIQSAWYLALDYFAANPDQSAMMMSPRLGVDPLEVPALFDGLHLPAKEQSDLLLKHHGGNSPELLNSASNLYELMRQQGAAVGSVELKELFP